MASRLEEIRRGVRGLKPLIVEHRAEAERLKHLPGPVRKAFLDLDLYRILVPEDLGGSGLDPLAYFDLCEELASYDGSVGWNFALASTCSPPVALPTWPPHPANSDWPAPTCRGTSNCTAFIRAIRTCC